MVLFVCLFLFQMSLFPKKTNLNNTYMHRYNYLPSIYIIVYAFFWVRSCMSRLEFYRRGMSSIIVSHAVASNYIGGALQRHVEGPSRAARHSKSSTSQTGKEKQVRGAANSAATTR